MNSDRDRRGPHTLSEADIVAATVGDPVVHDGPIELHPYDPTWPDAFERERGGIVNVLGPRAERVEHVGSTSVPGLAAKPIIDIVLVVHDSSDEDAYVPPMEAAGYVLRIREPNWFEHRLFKGPDTDCNVHVFSVGCTEIDRMVRFRDRLRSDRADRERYLAKKRELAARRWKYTQNYADAKGAVIEAILRS